MKTPEECLEMLSAAYNCSDVAITETIKLIQLDALTQGRKDGREQGIRESAEVKVPFPSNLSAPWIEEIFAQGLEAKSLAILALLNHPSPKEQEK